MDMTDYITCLQAVAAISSAIAAIAAVYVARSTFIFQKQLLLKKMIIEQIQKLCQQLYYLKSLTIQNALNAADDDVAKLNQRIAETQECIVFLKFLISDSAQVELQKVNDFARGLRADSIFSDDNTPNDVLCRELDDAIGRLQKIYCKELK